MKTSNVAYLDSPAARERSNQIEALFCDLYSITALQHLAVDGEHRTPVRDWLARQQERCLQALEELVMPQH